MSLFDSASLIVTPNAYKAGKLYSLKPSDGAGDLSVTRATTATYVDADGVIQTAGINEPRFDYSNGSCPSILVEPQRSNLLLDSDGNLSTYPTKSGVIDSLTKINSFSNAIYFDNNPSTIYAYKSASLVQGTIYTFSCFIEMDDNSVPVPLTDFKIVISFTAVTSLSSYSIEHISNNTYRISGYIDSTVNGNTSCGIVRYNYNSLKKFKVSGYQLEQGANATSYIPTTSSTVTRNADVISKSVLSGITTITETFEDDTTNVISGSPTSYTMSQGRIKHVIGL